MSDSEFEKALEEYIDSRFPSFHGAKTHMRSTGLWAREWLEQNATRIGSVHTHVLKVKDLERELADMKENWHVCLEDCGNLERELTDYRAAVKNIISFIEILENTFGETKKLTEFKEAYKHILAKWGKE